MLPAAAGQPEMIEAMRERRAGDGDAQTIGGGEVGQRLTAGVVTLREEHLLVRAVQGAPFCDAPLERAAQAVGNDVGTEFVLQILEDRHGHHAGDRQHLHNPGPDIGQRIGAGSPTSLLPLLRRQARILVDAARRARAEAGHGGGGFLIMAGTRGHVAHHLGVGRMKVWHQARLVGETSRNTTLDAQRPAPFKGI